MRLKKRRGVNHKTRYIYIWLIHLERRPEQKNGKSKTCIQLVLQVLRNKLSKQLKENYEKVMAYKMKKTLPTKWTDLLRSASAIVMPDN